MVDHRPDAGSNRLANSCQVRSCSRRRAHARRGPSGRGLPGAVVQSLRAPRWKTTTAVSKREKPWDVAQPGRLRIINFNFALVRSHSVTLLQGRVVWRTASERKLPEECGQDLLGVLQGPEQPLLCGFCTPQEYDREGHEGCLPRLAFVFC